jgi:hypothetical protein
MGVHRMRRLLEWGSKARKEEARLRGRANEERAQLEDQWEGRVVDHFESTMTDEDAEAILRWSTTPRSVTMEATIDPDEWAVLRDTMGWPEARADAAPGECPWSDNACDEQCHPFHGCKLEGRPSPLSQTCERCLFPEA